jgi:hypothetical protein
LSYNSVEIIKADFDSLSLTTGIAIAGGCVGWVSAGEPGRIIL